MTPEDILYKYWGYDSFRPGQEDIVNSVLSGHDTVGLMPTGGGKSITFQVPAMMLDGVTVVITPLISLMKDQVDNLAARGIRAVALHSGLSYHEKRTSLDRIAVGKVKIIYIAPERLTRAEFLAEVKTWNVNLIVVDEAHCISQWGYDFRPSYLRIQELRKVVPDAPVLALTASATPEVVKDIAEKLGMRSPAIFSRSFSRNNISYLVRYVDDKESKLVEILSVTKGSTIVYVRSRKLTMQLAETLDRMGFSAEYYHAGLEPHDKSDKQDRWKRGEVRIMVATNAFGMGIDKPDVRLVVHYTVPQTLEEYYQEAGRAGRDGKESYAVILATSADKGLLKRRLTEEYPGRPYLLTVYEKLGNFLEIPVGGGYNQVYECDFVKFCRLFKLQKRPTAAALGILTRAGAIEYCEDMGSRARVIFIVSRQEIYNIEFAGDAESVVYDLLRNYPGLFADYVNIDESDIAARSGLTSERVYQALLTLSRMKVVSYVPRRMFPYVYYPTSRDLPKYVEISRSVYEDRLEQATKRMEAVRNFVFECNGCRVQSMLQYFGESDAVECGKCDYCRAKKKSFKLTERTTDAEEIIEMLLDRNPEGLRVVDIKPYIKSDFDLVLEIIRRRVDEGTLKWSDGVIRKG